MGLYAAEPALGIEVDLQAIANTKALLSKSSHDPENSPFVHLQEVTDCSDTLFFPEFNAVYGTIENGPSRQRCLET